jgi:hypothetical protein
MSALSAAISSKSPPIAIKTIPSTVKKYLRPVLYGLLAILLLGQFVRPAKNRSNDQTNHVRQKYPVPDSVEAILRVACYDCHSNYTRYPWYAEVQPVASWLAHHVEEGSHELNFSNFTTRRVAVQNHKFEEIIESQKEGWMPLNSYTWTHLDARLSDQQRQTLIIWAGACMDSLRHWYPADSLVLKRR